MDDHSVPIDDDLFDLLAAAQADDAARSRAGIGALREIAIEDATLPSLLLSCAEKGRFMRLGVGARSISGTVVDACSSGAVITDGRTVSIIRLDAIDSITTSGSDRPELEARSPRSSTWTELLHRSIERHDIVTIDVRGSITRGELLSIGREVMSLSASDGSMLYVRIESLDIVTTLASAS